MTATSPSGRATADVGAAAGILVTNEPSGLKTKMAFDPRSTTNNSPSGLKSMSTAYRMMAPRELALGICPMRVPSEP